MAKQLHIFLENKPGRLESVAEILFKNKISVIAFSIQDRGDFGLSKLLVDDPQRAHLVLKDKGYACALKDIVLVTIKDKVGNFYKLTKVILDNKINIADAHGFVTTGPRGVCAIEVNEKELARAKKILEKEGFATLETEQLTEMA